MPSPRRLALVAVLALSTVAAPSTALAAGGGDQAVAKQILLRAKDYPVGWKVEGGSPATDSGCFSKVEKAHGDTVRVSASPDFVDATGSQRSGASVSLYASARKAHAAFLAVTGPAPLACYRTTISGVLRKTGLTVTNVATAPLRFVRLGDATTSRRLAFGVRKGADSATLIIDLIFVQRARALISVGFNAESQPPVVADEHTTIARAVSRVGG